MFKKWLYVGVKVFFTEFIFVEIPNILQIFGVSTLFLFLFEVSKYNNITYIFFILMYIYLLSRLNIFWLNCLKDRLSFIYLYDIYEKKFKIYITWFILLLMFTLFSLVLFNKIIIYTKANEVILNCKLDFILKKDFSIENCIDWYLK